MDKVLALLMQSSPLVAFIAATILFWYKIVRPFHADRKEMLDKIRQMQANSQESQNIFLERHERLLDEAKEVRGVLVQTFQDTRRAQSELSSLLMELLKEQSNQLQRQAQNDHEMLKWHQSQMTENNRFTTLLLQHKREASQKGEV